MMPIGNDRPKKRSSYLKQGRNSKGHFTKKRVKYSIWDRIKKWFNFLIIFLVLGGCSRYQVVSEVDLHMYHMHNPKSNKVEVILTKEKLEVGKFYRLKSIKQVKVE